MRARVDIDSRGAKPDPDLRDVQGSAEESVPRRGRGRPLAPPNSRISPQRLSNLCPVSQKCPHIPQCGRLCFCYFDLVACRRARVTAAATRASRRVLGFKGFSGSRHDPVAAIRPIGSTRPL
eukprot:1082371-Prorocentrum_minimum.AAC.7